MVYPSSSKRCRDLSSSFNITWSALVWLALTLLQLVSTQTIVVADLFEFLSTCFTSEPNFSFVFFFIPAACFNFHALPPRDSLIFLF